MFRRARPPENPVTVYLDGAPVVADRGEPLAVALLAADQGVLGRSPKLHRPRAPACLRGGCDGCLSRVDGVPNVMTCLRRACGGERIEAQNVVGSRKADLLRVTDWFFPHGIDHHHLMAGVPGVQGVVQSFARKLSGVGRLPASPEPAKAARRAEVDVLVAGGGPAGIAAASRLAERGRSVLLADDGLEPGGSLAADPRARDAVLERCAFAARVLAPGESGARPGAVWLVQPGTVAGLYTDRGLEALVSEEEGAILVRPGAVLLATGAHDPVLATANDDLPGVMSARAVCRLLSRGLEPTDRVAIVGSGFWADRLEALLGPERALRVEPGEVVSIHGRNRVRGLARRQASGEEAVEKVAVVAVAGRGAPSFELAEQGGASARLDPTRGYVVVRDERGRAGERLWAAGECAGLDFDPEAMARDAERVADALSAVL